MGNQHRKRSMSDISFLIYHIYSMILKKKKKIGSKLHYYEKNSIAANMLFCSSIASLAVHIPFQNKARELIFFLYCIFLNYYQGAADIYLGISSTLYELYL